MSLHADVRLSRGAFTLDARVDVPAGEVLAVLGPNGSGKSTLLSVIAGLLRPDAGVVRWGDRDLTRVPGATVPARRRRVGLLGQDPLLFPHLDVTENVAFGPRSVGRRDALAHARGWLERLELGALARRRPRELSGGQAARVALARVLASEPEVLLLDEPLAALDVGAAPELRQVLAQAVREVGTTTVLVSHDLLDAVVLADRVAVLREGSVVEAGVRAEVFAAPRTAFTAALLGINLVPVGFAGLPAVAGADETTQLRFRPAAVDVGTARSEAPGCWRATVRWTEPATGAVRLRLATDGAPDVLADLDPAAVDPALLRPGAEVWARVRAEDVQAV